LLIDFCLIFVPFGLYDEPEILPYENTSMCPKGDDGRHAEAEPLLKRALEINRKSFGSDLSVIKTFGTPEPIL